MTQTTRALIVMGNHRGMVETLDHRTLNQHLERDKPLELAHPMGPQQDPCKYDLRYLQDVPVLVPVGISENATDEVVTTELLDGFGKLDDQDQKKLQDQVLAMETIVDLAEKVRTAQVKYFADRTHDNLMTSKALEAELDDAIKFFKNPQKELFQS